MFEGCAKVFPQMMSDGDAVLHPRAFVPIVVLVAQSFRHLKRILEKWFGLIVLPLVVVYHSDKSGSEES